MEAKDLMVGDWVQHYNGKYYQVTKVDRTHFACGFPYLWDYNNKFYPVLLTKEIVLQISDYDEELEEHHINGITIYYDPETEDWDVGKYSIGFTGDELHYITTIKYVHELQNILNSLKIRNEIKL